MILVMLLCFISLVGATINVHVYVGVPGFHPVEGVGGGEASLPKHPASPQKKKERKKLRKEGEREGGRGEHILFGAAIQVISNPLVYLFLRALDKTTEYPQTT
jgi:hypothetical protein